jgi:hypothetical protein
MLCINLVLVHKNVAKYVSVPPGKPRQGIAGNNIQSEDDVSSQVGQGIGAVVTPLPSIQVADVFGVGPGT